MQGARLTTSIRTAEHFRRNAAPWIPSPPTSGDAVFGKGWSDRDHVPGGSTARPKFGAVRFGLVRFCQLGFGPVHPGLLRLCPVRFGPIRQRRAGRETMPCIAQWNGPRAATCGRVRG